MLVPTSNTSGNVKNAKSNGKQKINIKRKDQHQQQRQKQLNVDDDTSYLLEREDTNNNNNNSNNNNNDSNNNNNDNANNNHLDNQCDENDNTDSARMQELIGKIRYKFLEKNYLLDLLSLAHKQKDNSNRIDLSQYKQYDYSIEDVMNLINDDTLIRCHIGQPPNNDNNNCSTNLSHTINIDDCVKAIDETLKWRKSIQLDRLSDESFPLEFYQMNGLFVQGTDKHRLPVMYMRAQAHRKWSPKLDEMFKKFVAYQIERVTRANASNGGAFTICFDCRGSNYACLDIEFLRYLSRLLVQYYPSACRYAVVVELPWIFRSVWKLVRTWLPPEAQESVKFVPLKQLHEIIDQENLPTCMLAADAQATPTTKQSSKSCDNSIASNDTIGNKNNRKITGALGERTTNVVDSIKANANYQCTNSSTQWTWTVPNGCRSMIDIGPEIGITQSELNAFMDHVNRLSSLNA
ncbi:Motile sperm domain-containing protein 2 [Fragariocoptes setiger]|uniref:Motile sperm domain-containing protein 2 n=1 Tax=Fragariocoptes setiger TaxID=1670756 RepID=A0ABQ7S9K6_9ACAR|nr:Motile sperm domain-containing protein 2 [Fragariocoptes setiger]